MNLEEFNDPEFDLPAFDSGAANRPLSQMFADPLHVEQDDGNGRGGTDFGFDSNFDSDFAGFDNDFAALSTASLPPLNSIPGMSNGDGLSDGFGGFGTHAPPPPSAQAPVFVASDGGFVPGGRNKWATLCCLLLYCIILILLIIIILLSILIVVMVFRIDNDINNLKMEITVPVNPPNPSYPPQIGALA